jgi:ribosome-associated translation inhibitor RaiA
MQIQLHTDRNVAVSARAVERIETDIEAALSRFGDQITRVDVHVSSETAGRPNIRCVMEARSAGRQPVAVTHHAPSVGEACAGAMHKLASLMESKYGRSDNRKGGESLSHLEVREGLS